MGKGGAGEARQRGRKGAEQKLKKFTRQRKSPVIVGQNAKIKAGQAIVSSRVREETEKGKGGNQKEGKGGSLTSILLL